ncbi:MAG: AhpC/TSA family protein [Opitutae bacterium]|nr:AhpC/TSA family protein [Opitutae bacterium]
MKLRHLFAVFPAAALAASAALAPSVDATRPLPVGSRTPDPVIRTMTGTETTLSQQLSAKPTVLIFYRGGWCPYCNKHLAALADAEQDLLQLGYQIVAISADAPAGLQTTSEKQHLKYRLLSDRDMAASAAFGVAFRVDAATVAKYRDYQIDLPPVPGEPDARWLPEPAVFLIDRHGAIRFVHANADYRVRIAVPELLAAARQARE